MFANPEKILKPGVKMQMTMEELAREKTNKLGKLKATTQLMETILMKISSNSRRKRSLLRTKSSWLSSLGSVLSKSQITILKSTRSNQMSNTLSSTLTVTDAKTQDKTFSTTIPTKLFT